MSRSSSLRRLDQLDREADRIAHRLREIGAEKAADHRVSQARARLEQAEADQRHAHTTAATAEDELSGLRTKMSETDKRLYGGSIHNPKELADLESEAQALARRLPLLEEQVLAAMLRLEEAEASKGEAESALETGISAVQDKARELDLEASTLGLRSSDLDAEREAASQDVVPEDLALYNSLRASLGGAPLALLEDGSCGSCGMTLTASQVQSVRQGQALTRCPQCGRILYSH